MKTKVVVIHGGDTYPSQEMFIEKLRSLEIDVNRMRPTRRWKDTLQEKLGNEYEVFFPRMPLQDNADYGLWKMWFEKILTAVDGADVLIGHSLGAMFLLKYYSEMILEKPLPALFLLAPEYFGNLSATHTPTSFDLQEDISPILGNVGKVVFFFSKDDTVVPFENMETFKTLLPAAEFRVFPDRGHFNTELFPELVEEVTQIPCADTENC